MRDWHQTATDFDTLAFDTTATGQFLPLVKIDNTPVSPQLQKSFGLAAYVGETRTFGETGEPVHEAVASVYEKHVNTVEQIGGIACEEFERVNQALGRLERFWTDQIRYKL
jgi:hypothetical protein